MNPAVVERQESVDRTTAVKSQKVTIGGVSAALPERLTLPAMGSFVVLLYGVDLLFGDSPAAPWFEFILAGSVLLLGRQTLERGFQSAVYKLQPDGDTLLTIGAVVAFLYSFLVSLLYSLGELSTRHLFILPEGTRTPALFFTTTGTVIFGATLGRSLLERGERLLIERRDGQWRRLMRLSGNGSTSAEMLRRKWETRSALSTLAERLGLYWTFAVVLLAALAGVGGILGSVGLNAAIVGSMITFFLCSAPTAFEKVVRGMKSLGCFWAGAEGFLLQNSRSIELLSRVTAVCFNKLGTLTVGCPQVTDVEPIAPGYNADEVLYLASVLETQADHPFRDAILLEISGSARTIPRVRGFRSMPGKGLRAVYQGQEMILGNRLYLEELGVDCESARERVDELARSGKTVLLLAKGGELVGLLALYDEKRPEASEAMSQLRKLGVRTAVTSGDSQETVEAIAADMGFDEIYAGMSKDACGNLFRELNGRGFKVGMVGGGVANASTLAQADLGIAFGVGQEGLAQSADVVLKGEDLREIPRAIDLARRTRGWLLRQFSILGIFQGVLLLLVGALWLDRTLLLREAADPEASAQVWGLSYLPDILGFVTALLPAAVVWVAYAGFNRFERYELENRGEAGV